MEAGSVPSGERSILGRSPLARLPDRALKYSLTVLAGLILALIVYFFIRLVGEAHPALAKFGVFGFTFLDWAQPSLTDANRKRLGRAADGTIRAIHVQWDNVKKSRSDAYHAEVGDALGWMQSDAYLVLAKRSMETRVREPLRARGIPISA